MFSSLFFYLYLGLISYSDLKSGLIPNILVYSLFLTVFSLKISTDFNRMFFCLVAAIAVTLILLAVRHFTKGLGAGDIKLLFVTTFCTGFFCIVLAIIVSCLAGILAFCLLKALRKPVLTIPFAPFITLGYLSVDLFGKKFI